MSTRDKLQDTQTPSSPPETSHAESHSLPSALPSVEVPRTSAVTLARLMSPPLTDDACLACKSVFNYPIARWDQMPLSVLGLPRSEREARHMKRLVMDVRQCANCGHVFHTEFNYDHIPYRTGSNLVYNEGESWKTYQDHLVEEWVEDYELTAKRIVEIGCGEGLFLERLAKHGNHCIGFEPGPDAQRASARGIEAYPEYFQGSRLYDLKADALICRHVIEHLASPLDFLEDIAIACCENELAPLFFAEVPLIEKAMLQNRINDFLYEHVSNFTRNSFRTMFERAGFEVLDIQERFDSEVVTIVARPQLKPQQKAERLQAALFRESVEKQISDVRNVLLRWNKEGRKVALWGGTGKGAAFINMFSLGQDIAPIVVDSDARKVGGYVPGTGQEIKAPQFLIDHPVEKILICTNWRARDIEREIRERHGLSSELHVYLNESIQPLTSTTKL